MELMLKKYHQLPLDVLINEPSASAFFSDCGVVTWGDVEDVKSDSKRKRLRHRLPLWCHHFPEYTSGWRCLHQPETLSVVQNFEPPIQNNEALLFLLRPLCERFCARLDACAVAVVQLELQMKLYCMPSSSDVHYESKKERHREWRKQINFQVPMAHPESLLQIVLTHVKALQGAYEIYHLSLQASQTNPLVMNQGHLWQNDDTLLKMPFVVGRNAAAMGGIKLVF